MDLDVHARGDLNERGLVEVVGVELDDRAVETALQKHLGSRNGLAGFLRLLLPLLLHAAAGVPEHEHQEGAQQDEQAVVEEEILEIHEEGRLSGAAAQTSGRVGVKASRNYRSSNLSD